jgi:hypothetical protein
VSKTKEIEKAADIYLRAEVAYRDAKQILRLGFSLAIESAGKVLEREPTDMDEAMLIAATKEASDILELYGRSPDDYPQGVNAESALKDALKRVKARYRNGKCHLCKGPAFECAKRHIKGRSCA